MTEADPWGLQLDYLDNADQPARVSDETAAALREIIARPDPDVEARAPIVLHPGDATAATGTVELEDGTEATLDANRPVDLPYGYHRLDERRLIVAPRACVLPPRRMWGWTAQLYASRSSTSWGIGDLGDLRRITTMAAAHGAGFVLVNPLHAGNSSAVDEEQEASPYSPTTRRFLDPRYLSVPEIDGAREALGARLVALAASGAELQALPRIDRDAVWRLKRAALRAVFDRTEHDGFTAWRAQRGQALEDFAAWSVLAERHGPSWREWPSDARRPDGPAVAALRAENSDDLAFVCWLQWQLEQQLRAAGAALPVLQDLPIGVNPNGADAWAFQELLADDATVGCPPDPFNQAGQDWGLQPIIPWRLRAADYEPFVQAVRATIALAGGLRIDHVMGLFRLWWIPTGMGATDGGYVRYPAGDLLDIVALESHRANAPVVGEDLGTVEPGVREELEARNVLSYRLLWFEDEKPEQWPTTALAAVATHDLPTVAGLWSGADLVAQEDAGVDADEAATHRLRQLLVDRAGLTDDATETQAVDGAYRLLGRAPSLLLAASLDDAVGAAERPNLPGTSVARNWSTPLPVPLDELATQPSVSALADIMTRSTT